MVHQDFQEAIAQVSKEGMSSEEIKSKFNLSSKEMAAMNASNSKMQPAATRNPALCSCCCYQSEN